jgi:hypothetical protein
MVFLFSTHLPRPSLVINKSFQVPSEHDVLLYSAGCIIINAISMFHAYFWLFHSIHEYHD